MAVKVPPIHVDSFNPVAHAAGDLPLESLENLAEDLAQKGFKGKGLVAEFLKKHEWFLGQRKLTLPATMAIAAMLAKVGQKFGMGSTPSAILYEIVKHGLAGASEGAFDAVQTSKEEKKAAWEKQVDEAVTHVPDELPEPDANEFLGRIRKGDSVIHATNKDCSIVMGFTDGHEAGSKNRDKIVLTAFSAGKTGGGKRGKDEGEGAGLIVKELKGDEKRVEYHSGNIADLLQRGNTFLCKLCYPDGTPKEAPHEEKHGHGLKDKFGEKAVDVFLAANATIATMGVGKLFAIDEIQEWKDIDPDLMKAMAERLHPNIVDGKLPRADLEELMTLIPASGVEKLSVINTAGKLWKSAKEILGESPKKDEKPLLEEYSLELVDFLAASENYYNELDPGDRKGFDHLVRALVEHPDLTELDELAKKLWTTDLRDGKFKDDAQFQAWNSAVRTVMKAHEYDKERKHPTLRKADRIGRAFLTNVMTHGKRFAFVLVLGWVLLGLGGSGVKLGIAPLAFLADGAMGMIAISLVALIVLSLLLVLPEWALSVGDLFFPKKNRSDEAIASVRHRFAGATGIMLVYATAAYYYQATLVQCLLLFAASIIIPIAAAALLNLAGAYVALMRSQLLSGLVFSALVGAIPAMLIVGVLLDRFPDSTEMILRGTAMAAVALVFLVGAWKVFQVIAGKSESDHGHSIGMVFVALLAGLVVVGLGVKCVRLVQKADLDAVADLIPAKERVEQSTASATNAVNGGALEAAKQRAREIKGAAPATPVITTPTAPPAQQNGSGTAKQLTKPQIQAEIAQAEKKLKQEYGDNVPPLAELEKQDREFAKQLTDIRKHYEANDQLEDMTKDPAYMELIEKMRELSGKINLRKQVADLTKRLNTKDPAPTSVATNAMMEDGEEMSDAVKALCLKYPPLVREKMQNCKGV